MCRTFKRYCRRNIFALENAGDIFSTTTDTWRESRKQTVCSTEILHHVHWDTKRNSASLILQLRRYDATLGDSFYVSNFISPRPVRRSKIRVVESVKTSTHSECFMHLWFDVKELSILPTVRTVLYRSLWSHNKRPSLSWITLHDWVL